MSSQNRSFDRLRMRPDFRTGLKFHIHTLGCKVNQYESQAMRELLVGAGFCESGDREAADIYIVNTCTVTKEADKESVNVMGRFHRANPNARIVVTGCLAEKDALESMPGVFRVLRNSDKDKIVEAAGGASISHDFTISGFKGHSKAFVKIQDGCENRCAYCKVPLVRGALRSKPLDDISLEVNRLIKNGFKEIILTGICLGAWGKDLSSGHGLIEALKMINQLDGDFRIRLSSIEPKYVTEELIELVARSGRICRHLHVPFQSGDDDILRLMNRPYNSEAYRKIAETVRSRIPDIAITTDMLVGFPGESDDMFENTMAFLELVAPSRTHIFSFSEREGTPAYNMPDKIRQSTMRKRYDSMNALAVKMAHEYKRSFVGKELEILVESERDKKTGLLKGYSGNYIQVFFVGPDELMRDIVPVKITGIDLAGVVGQLIPKPKSYEH